MSHDEAGELLGAYALDAVDGEELTEVEAHLATCPRCRAELDTLREVAAAMGNSVEPLPEGLWSSIASRLPERDDDAEAPPMPRLASERRSPFRPPAGRTRRRRNVVAVLGAAAVAAAAVAVVLGIGLVRADDKVSGLQAAAGQTSAVHAALGAPGHTLVDLDTPSHVQLARFVVLPDGRGYLVSSSAPTLSADQTYQLWGIVGKEPISLGLLGDSPRQAAFTMAGATRPSQLSITAEPSGGSVSPTGPILATGTV
ncbi:MAG: anti-sigma factor [Acidimicrobiales bacterium]|jgi:anti-sigma-K factor RskA